MERCEYVTPTGSRVRPISATSWEIVFDWFEEGACVEAVPQVDTVRRAIVWGCACCNETGVAPLALRQALEE